MAVMTNVTLCNPHKEEDEGYLACESGRNVSDNPYPRGTIRFEEWRRGWRIKTNESRMLDDEGYMAADTGLNLAENPHPPGTIRHTEWRRGWQLKAEEIRRAQRLGRD